MLNTETKGTVLIKNAKELLEFSTGEENLMEEVNFDFLQMFHFIKLLIAIYYIRKVFRIYYLNQNALIFGGSSSFLLDCNSQVISKLNQRFRMAFNKYFVDNCMKTLTLKLFSATLESSHLRKSILYFVLTQLVLFQHVKKIVETGVNVIVSGGKVADLALHFANKYKVMVVRLNSKWDLRRLCKTVNATALPRLVRRNFVKFFNSLRLYE